MGRNDHRAASTSPSATLTAWEPHRKLQGSAALEKPPAMVMFMLKISTGLTFSAIRLQQENESEHAMNKNECQNERLSSRTVGIIIIVASLLLFAIGSVIIPVVGSLFAIPFLILGIGMIAAPDSKACKLVMGKLGSKKA
jgi:hypothetical protein